jgi:Flp pilus assembly protein TadG
MARPFSRQAGRQRSRGQTLVEVALVLPVFLVLLMILFDFGRVVYAMNTINQDAREGVRRGIVSTSSISVFQDRFDEIRAAALTMAPAVPITGANIYGDVGSCSDVDTATGGTPAMLDDDDASAFCFYPNGLTNADPATPPKVVVHIRVTVGLITPIISNIVGDGITLDAQAEQLIQS